MPRVLWAAESKTDLEFGIGPRQQKCQRTLNVNLMVNPVVLLVNYGQHFVFFVNIFPGWVRKSRQLSFTLVFSLVATRNIA